MAGIIRVTCEHGGSFRLGHACHVWGDDFTRALSYENDRDEPDVAVIGGLTWRLSGMEYRWLADALRGKGFRGAAIDRVVRGADGKPLRNPDGTPIMRRVILPVPKRRAGKEDQEGLD